MPSNMEGPRPVVCTQHALASQRFLSVSKWYGMVTPVVYQGVLLPGD